MLDPAVLAGIADLRLLAKLAVEGLRSGLHRSVTHGFGMEFHQYRDYSPGEDLKYLDWKVLARTNRLCTKVFEEETNTQCLLLLDVSASMAYQGAQAPCSKLRYAVMLAACLAWLTQRQGDHPGLCLYGESLRQVCPPRGRQHDLQRLLQVLASARAEGVADGERVFPQTWPHARRRSLVVVLSDAVEQEDSMPAWLKGFTARGSECLLLRVLDPDEHALPDVPQARFIDAETQRAIVARPEALREDYRTQMARATETLRQGCLRAGVQFADLTTSESLLPVLARFLRLRETFVKC